MTVFDEEEIVAGDIVKTELDSEVLKMMHEAAALWMTGISQVRLMHIHQHNLLSFVCTNSSEGI